MVIWGGSDAASTAFGDGARYNPVANTWTPISAAGAPSARYYFPSVWSGAEMIVWAGAGPGANVNNGTRYNPATDSWTAMSTIGAPPVAPAGQLARFQHTGVWTGSELIIWGGGNGGAVYNNGGCYNPASDTWTLLSTTGTPPARFFHSAAWAGNQMLLWGGRISFSSSTTAPNDVWCFRKCP